MQARSQVFAHALWIAVVELDCMAAALTPACNYIKREFSVCAQMNIASIRKIYE
jgi:hypothetical protein